MSPHPSNVWFASEVVEGQNQLAVVCFPHAGGGSAIFRSWTRFAPPELAIFAAQLPGREQRLRDPLIGDMPTLVDEIGRHLPCDPQTPLVLIGHSLGALVAFELARWLRRQGRTIRGLIAAGCPAPPLMPRVAPAGKPLHQLPDAELISQIQLRYGGLSEAAAKNAELMGLLLPAVRGDLRIVETYRYDQEPPLTCPIWALGGSDDSEVSPSDLAAWREQTNGPFSQRLFPGGHFFLDKARASIFEICRQLA